MQLPSSGRLRIPTPHGLLRRHPDLVFLLLILAAATLISVPTLFYGAPFGQDTIYHESWLRNFNMELLAGQSYPRWLHDLNGGAGSPGFFFYGPLPFYLAALFDRLLCPACESSVQLAVGTWILLLASGMAFYALAREYARPWVAAIGALAYMLMPYHFEIDLWRRFDFGEFSAYICMPLVFLFLLRTLRDARYLPALAASYAGLIASHIPAAMLFSLFLGAYTVLQCWVRKSPRPLVLLGSRCGPGLPFTSYRHCSNSITSPRSGTSHPATRPHTNCGTTSTSATRTGCFSMAAPSATNRLEHVCSTCCSAQPSSHCCC